MGSGDKAFFIFGYFEEDGTPRCVDSVSGEEAEQRFHMPSLIDEIVSIEESSVVHDPTGEFSRLTSLIQELDVTCFHEINPHLFATVARLRKLLPHNVFSKIDFSGAEPFPVFRKTAKLIFPSSRISLAANWHELPVPNATNSICRNRWPAARFVDTEEHATWLARYAVSSNLIWFSESGRDETFHYMGKPLFLASFSKFRQIMLRNDLIVNVHRGKKIDFYGQPLIELSITCFRRELLSGNKEERHEFPFLSLDVAPGLEHIPSSLWDGDVAYRTICTNRINSFLSEE